LTRLGNGTQVSKSHCALKALGAVDELNAVLGLTTISGKALIHKIQNQLFNIGADLSFSKPYNEIDKDIEEMEKQIDFFEGFNKPLKNFILPGGTSISAWFHYSRTICRRAERDVIELFEELAKEQVHYNKKIIVYLNRLSDFLFVLARYNNEYGSLDILWKAKNG